LKRQKPSLKNEMNREARDIVDRGLTDRDKYARFVAAAEAVEPVEKEIRAHLAVVKALVESQTMPLLSPYAAPLIEALEDLADLQNRSFRPGAIELLNEVGSEIKHVLKLLQGSEIQRYLFTDGEITRMAMPPGVKITELDNPSEWVLDIPASLIFGYVEMDLFHKNYKTQYQLSSVRLWKLFFKTIRETWVPSVDWREIHRQNAYLVAHFYHDRPYRNDGYTMDPDAYILRPVVNEIARMGVVLCDAMGHFRYRVEHHFPARHLSLTGKTGLRIIVSPTATKPRNPKRPRAGQVILSTWNGHQQAPDMVIDLAGVPREKP